MQLNSNARSDLLFDSTTFPLYHFLWHWQPTKKNNTQIQGYFILVMSHLDFTPIPEFHHFFWKGGGGQGLGKKSKYPLFYSKVSDHHSQSGGGGGGGGAEGVGRLIH